MTNPSPSQTGYFRRVAAQTGTRLWINNPTPSEVRKALGAGAIACTTNPTFAAKMLRTPETRDAALKLIERAVAAAPGDDEAAALAQRLIVAEMAKGFLPRFEATAGREGFVSLQGDPRLEDDPARIVSEALLDFALFSNCIAKIPVIPTGLAAIDCLVRLNKPVIATEIMGIAQALAACATYQRASSESGHAPAFFVTHISGIFDEQLKAEAEAAGVALSPEAVRLAGCAIARKQFGLIKQRGLPGVLLGGGARGLHHFTEMVGAPVDVTLNWTGSAQDLEERPPAIECNMAQAVPETVIRELQRLPTFARAYAEDGLKPEEFAEFSPVVRFRNQFLKGWNEMLAAVKVRRAALAVHRGFWKVGQSPTIEMRPGVFRSTLVYNPDNMLCHFLEKPGARVDLHTHLAVQSGFVLRGKVRFFDAAGKERIMGPGDAYIFNSNEPHGSVAVEETELVECFTPCRPEYLDLRD